MCSIHGGSAHGHQRGSSPRAHSLVTDKEDAPVLRRGHHSALKGATLMRPAHPRSTGDPRGITCARAAIHQGSVRTSVCRGRGHREGCGGKGVLLESILGAPGWLSQRSVQLLISRL